MNHKSREENKLIKKLSEVEQKNMGVNIRKLEVNNTDIHILYIVQISDRQMISENIIKPILQYNNRQELTIDNIISSIIYMDDVFLEYDENKITDYILSGKTVLFTGNEEKYIVANTFKVEKRNTESPEIQYSLKGPRDSFTENFESNISLIRYRVKDENLKIDNLIVGKRTKTKVGVIYIDDVVNPRYVSEVKERIDKINVDGIIESGYIQKYLLDSDYELFPTCGVVERSDKACADILEGKIIIIVEGGNLALSIPRLAGDFFDSGDDHYDDLYSGAFAKIIRFTALGIALSLSALYVAIVAFHSDFLPTEYIIALAVTRSAVPINAVMEAFLMEFVSEILREASVRLPSHIGPAFGIVGTLVIGQAAVSAGIVSPLLVIIIGLSTICSFIVSDHTMMNGARIFKFILIIITGVFGLYGFTLGYIFILVNIISASSLGAAYGAPFSPFNLKDFKNFMLGTIRWSKSRPNAFNVRNKKRQK